MAKKTTVMEDIINGLPRRAEFQITMVADSSTEVWADIDTGIDDRQAWVIYGMEWMFESIDPTVPLLDINSPLAYQIQLHRNDDSELMLNYADNDCIHTWKRTLSLATSGANQWEQPFRAAFEAVTVQPTLRVMFRTSADADKISLTTVQLTGAVLYDVIPAPAHATKLSSMVDL